VREIDNFERITWSRDERHEIYSLGQLPKEVQAVVKHADFVTSTVLGHVDPTSGYVFVATSRAVIAWNYQKVRNRTLLVQ
jgi:nuclear pore complex protein Nup133